MTRVRHNSQTLLASNVAGHVDARSNGPIKLSYGLTLFDEIWFASVQHVLIIVHVLAANSSGPMLYTQATNAIGLNKTDIVIWAYRYSDLIIRFACFAELSSNRNRFQSFCRPKCKKVKKSAVNWEIGPIDEKHLWDFDFSTDDIYSMHFGSTVQSVFHMQLEVV